MSRPPPRADHYVVNVFVYNTSTQEMQLLSTHDNLMASQFPYFVPTPGRGFFLYRVDAVLGTSSRVVAIDQRDIGFRGMSSSDCRVAVLPLPCRCI